MTITTVAGSVVAAPDETINLSSLFSVTADGNNPTYIDVTMLDRVEYPGISNHTLGSFYGNGIQRTDFHKLEVGYFDLTSTDAYDTGIIFTYQPLTGRYYNSTFGYFDQLTFGASPDQYRNAYISIFYTNDPSVLAQVEAAPSYYYEDPETLAGLTAQSNSGYVGTVDVITRTDISSGIWNYGTPNTIISAAQTFVGKVWNNEGCWVLASNIAAQAGTSLPATTPGGASLVIAAANPTTPVANGEWIVAYDGGAQPLATIASAEAVIRPGDVVTVAWAGGGGHITTVVSGFGAGAQVIDNEQTPTNSAHDGVLSDIIILGPHSLDSELRSNGAIGTSINIYRLDTPTVTIGAPNNTVNFNSALSLAPLFSTTDAGGAGTRAITEYAFYDVGTGGAASDSFQVSGVSQSSHSASAPLLVTAANLSTVQLIGGGSSGTDTVYIAAYNGKFWGDWQAVMVTLSETASISASTAVSSFQSGSISSPVSVHDSSANVASFLDGLQPVAAAGDIASIALTDGGTPYLNVSAAQSTNDVNVLHDITSVFALSISAATPNVTINGLTSQDIVVFTGEASQYSIGPVGTGPAFTVADTSTGRTSTDHLSNVEFLQFADRMMFVTTPAQAQIALLYQGTLGRTPDVPGLVGWQNVFNAEPASVQQADNFTSLGGTPVGGLPDLAYGFTQSVEFQQKYGTLDDGQFVTQLYANVLDRTPDSAGLNGWVNALAQGHTREWVLVGFVESAEAYHNAEVGYVGQTGTVHQPWLVVV